MTNSPLRTLHIGVGNRGASILKLAMQYGCAPVALLDAKPEFLGSARELAKLPESACFTDLNAALKAPDLQACLITSPARFHTAQMQAAIERGLHIFVAKPMTYDLDESRQLVELAEARGVAIVVDQQSQFALTERTAAQWIEEKKFGEVGYGSYIHHRHRPNMAAFTGGDPFIWEQGVHSFNSLIAMLGRRAVSVQAYQIKPAWSVYNGATVALGVIEFEGGVPIDYMGSFDSRQIEMDIRFECEGAALRISNASGHKQIFVAQPGKAFEACDIFDAHDSEPSERFNFESFHRAIGSGERVPNDGRDNLRTLAVVDAFIRSAREERKVPVTNCD